MKHSVFDDWGFDMRSDAEKYLMSESSQRTKEDTMRKYYNDMWTDAYFTYKNGEKLRTGIKDVIFNDPATIVMWSDGTKTVVKAVNEPFDKEKGLAMAIAKKALGNKGNYYNQFKKWVPHESK